MSKSMISAVEFLSRFGSTEIVNNAGARWPLVTDEGFKVNPDGNRVSKLARHNAEALGYALVNGATHFLHLKGNGIVVCGASYTGAAFLVRLSGLALPLDSKSADCAVDGLWRDHSIVGVGDRDAQAVMLGTAYGCDVLRADNGVACIAPDKAGKHVFLAVSADTLETFVKRSIINMRGKGRDVGTHDRTKAPAVIAATGAEYSEVTESTVEAVPTEQIASDTPAVTEGKKGRGRPRKNTEAVAS